MFKSASFDTERTCGERSRTSRSTQDKRGFTLIELLVAISIIAILSIVGFVSYQNVSSKAKDAKMKADIDAIKKAYETNYDPSANSGQGGYKALEDSQFASGKIPKQPNGDPYPCAVGPVGPDSTCTDNSTQGYHVSTILSNGTYYAAVSTQGTLAGSGTLSSCARNGLVGHWKMDEGAGATTAVDSAGSNNGTYTDGATTADRIPVQMNNLRTASLDGVDDYIRVPNNSVFNLTNVSVSLWVYRTVYNSSICNLLRRSEYDNFAIMCGQNSDTAWFKVRGSDGVYSNTPTVTLSLNQWTHLVGTFDGFNIKIYRNGTDGGQTPVSGAISYTSTGDLIIGRDDPTSGRYLAGQIDDVRVYNRALEPTEITALYNNGSGCI